MRPLRRQPMDFSRCTVVFFSRRVAPEEIFRRLPEEIGQAQSVKQASDSSGCEASGRGRPGCRLCITTAITRPGGIRLESRPIAEYALLSDCRSAALVSLY